MDASGGDYRVNKRVCFFKKKKQKTFVSLGLGIWAFGTAAAQTCALAGQHQEIKVTLYFGRDRTGEQPPVSNAEWQKFSATTLTLAFPDGFTESDGVGQWRDPKTGMILREPSKIIDAVLAAKGLPPKIATVTKDYEAKFDQLSVGVVTESVCARF